VAYGLWGEVLVWLIGAVVCPLAVNRGSSCSLTRALDGRILRCGIISLCQSAATFEIVKHFWATVRSVIAIVGLYLFTFFGLQRVLLATVKLKFVIGTKRKRC